MCLRLEPRLKIFIPIFPLNLHGQFTPILLVQGYLREAKKFLEMIRVILCFHLPNRTSFHFVFLIFVSLIFSFQAITRSTSHCQRIATVATTTFRTSDMEAIFLVGLTAKPPSFLSSSVTGYRPLQSLVNSRNRPCRKEVGEITDFTNKVETVGGKCPTIPDSPDTHS
jgi:hypothetical protein